MNIETSTAYWNHEGASGICGYGWDETQSDSHLVDLRTALEMIYLQQQGATASYSIADIEAQEDNKILLEKSEKVAGEHC